jgi:hypothetical protein
MNLDDGAGGSQVTFSSVLPVAGTYEIYAYAMGIYSTLGPVDTRFQLDIDAGTYQSADVNGWQLAAVAGERNNSSAFLGTVQLAAGSHDFKIRWRRLNAVNNAVTDVFSNMRVVMRLLSGSGAGGTILDIQGDTTNRDSTSTTPTVMMTHTNIAAVPGEEVQLVGSVAAGVTGASGANTIDIQYRINGGSWVLLAEQSIEADFSPDFAEHLSWDRTIVLPLASNSIEIGISRKNGSQTVRAFNASVPAVSEVRQARGGLVPVRQDGTTVVDKPAAFDFVNAQVTNVGGVAKIGLLGAEGIVDGDADILALSASFSNSTTSTWEDADLGGGDKLEKVINCRVDEWMLLVFNGDLYHPTTDFEGYIRFAIDGVGNATWIGDVARAGGTGSAAFQVAAVVPFKATATQHTITVQVYSITDTSIELRTQNSPGHGLSVIRFKGGYVQPDNIPVFERDSSDTSLIRANAALGANSVMRIPLNDGQIRTADLPLTCDIDVDGIGGRDDGDATGEAAGDLYHLYAVESDTDSTKIKLVLSKDAVPGISGPPSFPVYRYLWTVRISSIGPVVIEEFLMTGDGHYQPLLKNDTAYELDGGFAGTPSSPGAWLDLTTALRAVMPVSADEMTIEGYFGTLVASQYAFIAPEASPSWTPSTAAQPLSQIFLRCGSGDNDTNTRTLSNPQREFALWIQDGTATSHYWGISVAGYRNALYPGANAGTQAQAAYAPDTKGLKGTWASGTTVNFASRPGHASTSRWSAQSGKQRTSTGTLAWDDANNVADLGWDEAASQAAGDKWVYFYQVPKSGADDQFTIRASDNPPSVGPAGYTDWKLVWATYRSSGSLVKVYQAGNVFKYAVKVNKSIGGTTVDVSPVSLSLADAVPYSSAEVYVEPRAEGSSWVQTDLYVDGDTGGGSYARGQYNAAAGGNLTHLYVPTPTSPKIIHYKKTAGGTIAGSDLQVLGWIDEWIDP